MRLAVRLGNLFDNQGHWQFGSPTDSLMAHFRQYIQLLVHERYLNKYKVYNTYRKPLLNIKICTILSLAAQVS